MKKIHNKLAVANQLLLVDTTKLNGVDSGLPFFGEFNLSLNFIENRNIPTCGVNITREGINLYYNSDFLDSLPQKQVNFILLHEDFHILFDHHRRTDKNYNFELANVAQDMIINYIILQDIPKSYAELPTDSMGRNMGVFLPDEYDGKLIFEELYKWLEGEYDNYRMEKSKKDKEDFDTKSEEYGQYGKNPNGDNPIETYSKEHIFDSIMNGSSGEFLDKHLLDEVSKEMKDIILKDINEKIRGNNNSMASVILNKLSKKKKDYLSDIKRNINEISGSIKDKTITKPNRRNIMGLKGKRKRGSVLNVVLDTSGSMYGIINRILEYVYQKDISINFIQNDMNVKSIKRLRSGVELEKIKIEGFGGTILMPAIKKIEQSYNRYNTVILTDGYCDDLDLSRLNGKVLIISMGRNVNIIKSNNKIRQMIIGGDLYL